MPVKNKFFFYTGGRVLNAGLSLATLLTINQLIPPAEYGRYAYLTMCGGLLSLACYGWVWSYSFRHAGHTSVASGLSKALYWLMLSVPFALLLLGLLVLLQPVNLTEFAYLFLYPIVLSLFNSGQRIHASKSMLMANIVYAVLRSATNLILLLIFIFTLVGSSKLYMATLLAYLAVVILLLVRERVGAANWKPTMPGINNFSYGFGIAGGALITQLNYALDKFVVNTVLGDKSTGLYSQSHEFIFFIIMFVFSIYNISTYPKLQRQFDADQITLRQILHRNLRWFVAIALLLTMFMLLVNPVFSILISENYRSAFIQLYVYNIAISLLSCFIAFHINYAFQLKKQPRFQVYAGVIAFILNLILSLVLVKSFGLTGVASATIAAQLAMILISTFYIRKLR